MEMMMNDMTNYVSFQEMLTWLNDFAIPYSSVSDVITAAQQLGFTAEVFRYENEAPYIWFVWEQTHNATNPEALDAIATGSAAGAFSAFTGAGGTLLRGIAKTGCNIVSGIKNGASALFGALSVPIPTVMAAAAPFMGIAAGVGLYNLNPDFWEKASRAILPWVWDKIDGDTPEAQLAEAQKAPSKLVKAVTDSSGTLYLPKDMITALKDVVTEYVSTQESMTGDFTFSTGTKGAKSPLGKCLYQWENRTLGTKLSSGMTFTTGKKIYIHRYEDDNGDGVKSRFISIVGSHVGEEEAYYDAWTTPYEFPHVGIAWPSGNTLEVEWYLIREGDIYKAGVEIKDGNHPWFINTEFPQAGWYIIDVELGNITEIGTSFSPSELPQVTPDTMTQPTIQINTGTDTEEYYPVEFPNDTPDPSIFISPNPGPEAWPSDYPYPIPTPETSPVADPETSPEADPDAEPESELETDTPQEVIAPPDTGETPEPDVVITPPIQSAAGGLLTVYNPTAYQLGQFGQWMWSTWSGNVTDTLQKLFLNHPLDGVIGLHEYYATPDASGGMDYIKVGFLQSDVQANIVVQRYTSINCGNVLIPEYYGNYLDYAPYTQVTAYLPFVGFVSLDADDIIGHAVNITYQCDSYTGCVDAMITCANANYSALRYQFEGNAAVMIPLTSGNQLGIVTSAISAAGSGIVGALSGGIGGGMAAIATSALNAATTPKASVSHSGSFGGTFGAMGLKKPYLIIRRPVQKEATNYQLDYGLPAHKRVKLSECSGYVRGIECNVISATATNEEKRMIEDLIKGGVYV